MSAMLFLNGRILTGEGLLAGAPQLVSALLVENGTITAAGSGEEVSAAAPAGAVRVDLEGRFAMPGINDAHLHLGEGARLGREVSLRGARSLEELLDRITEAAARTPPGTWLTGGGWDETLWPGHRLPTRYDLDRATRGRPAVFARIDVHLAVASSAALRIAGVTRETVSPPGSAIDRDTRGEATGILRERAARELVERHVPPVTPEQRRRGLREVLREALALGITSVQDYSVDEDFAALCALHAAGELPVRVSEWLPFDASLEELRSRRDRAPCDRRLRTGMLKAFLDGSLGSRTARLLAPYMDMPATRGLALYEAERLRAMAVERAAAGFALGFHAIGDEALRMALDTFAAVRKAVPDAERLRIEHAQTAEPGASTRARDLGAIASMQPNHLLTDMRWTEARLGPERAAYAHAWRSFAEAGVPLAFGTDYPVEPLCPWRGLYAAVTRKSVHGGSAFHPEQCLRLTEALHACTEGAAFAEGAEDWKGLLAPGRVADFIVLDRDLLGCAREPGSILETRVLRTVIDGETVYQAESG